MAEDVVRMTRVAFKVISGLICMKLWGQHGNSVESVSGMAVCAASSILGVNGVLKPGLAGQLLALLSDVLSVGMGAYKLAK
jgi:hypothetical protein